MLGGEGDAGFIGSRLPFIVREVAKQDRLLEDPARPGMKMPNEETKDATRELSGDGIIAKPARRGMVREPQRG